MSHGNDKAACNNPWFYGMIFVNVIPLFISHLDLYMTLRIAEKETANNSVIMTDNVKTLKSRLWRSVIVLILSFGTIVIFTHNAFEIEGMAGIMIFRVNEILMITVINFLVVCSYQTNSDLSEAAHVYEWILKCCFNEYSS